MYTIPEIVKQKVYEQVKKVPKGKVTTYGEIAKAIGINPRVVGNALHLNESADVPCHRVVNVVGRIAPNFGLGGPAEHRKRLQDEGVTFKDELRVNLTKHLFSLREA